MSEEETSRAENGAEQNETSRDWVEEAYECFIKNATGIEPTNPVKAIEVYFEKNARDELKERAKAEGKTAATCWRFIEAVARKALHGSGHIDPTVVYAIAMHYFEDVPVSWDKPAKRKEEVRAKSEEVKEEKPKKKAKKSEAQKTGEEEAAKTEPTPETANEPSGTASAQRAAPARPARNPRGKTQGFFFEMMENEVKAEGEGEDGGEDAHSSADS